MKLFYSFIVPVYNRPEEIKELLMSLMQLTNVSAVSFEIVIIEDGSTISCKTVCEKFEDKLSIRYISKPNTGPGDSRNEGMIAAQGNYFIILDSDVLVPPTYLSIVDQNLKAEFVHCYGGPDAASASFNSLQKAISFAMTSFWTTGGIRGGKNSGKDFQPRSFNMGLSKEAFIASKGFGKIHPGEDPDLVIRLWNLNFQTKSFPNAFVYHKRRISWRKFYNQVRKFGLVRPILNQWHPTTAKITYWFPTIFCGFLVLVLAGVATGFHLPLYALIIYMSLLVIISTFKYKSLLVGIKTIIAVGIQFVGYGVGFLQSYYYIHLCRKKPKKKYPHLFFE